MKRTIIDASQMELNDKVVAIKRVSKTVKGGRTMRFSARLKKLRLNWLLLLQQKSTCHTSCP